MTRIVFDALVRRIESVAARSPRRLPVEVALWALLGYAGFLSRLAVVWLAGGGLFAGGMFGVQSGGTVMMIAGACILVFGTAAVMRFLWVDLHAPEGIVLTKSTAPALMEEIARLRAALGAKPIFRVLLTPECNAGVSEVPRFGIFGWPRNYLILGLPLMDELTPDEFRAVLAHEFAHLSGRHGRFSTWVYRVRRTWAKVFENWQENAARSGFLRKLADRFVRWWWPRFNARAFVLSRQCEYEADRAAARLTAPEHVATGLLRVKVLDRLIDERVQRLLMRRAADEPEPIPGYTMLLREHRENPEYFSDMEQWCREAFLIATGNSDTHPALTDRMNAAGAIFPAGTEGVPGPANPPAADFFFGENLCSLRAAVDALWQKDCAASWQVRHTAAADLNRRAAGIAPASESPEHLWEQARTLASLHGDTAAVPVLERLLTAHPAHADGNLLMGRHLLARGDAARGEACLEQAVQANEQSLGPAAELLHQHYRRTGQADRLRALDARLDREETDREAAAKERSSVTASDTFVRHTLTREELQPLLDLLEREPRLVRADLAQKRLQHRPAQRLFVLCLHGRGRFPGPGRAANATDAVRRLMPLVRLPGRLLVVAAGGPLGKITRKVARQEGVTIWQR